MEPRSDITPWVKLAIVLILCTLLPAGAVQPDTARLARHLEPFRKHKAGEMSATEYRSIQSEYLTWINLRLRARARFAQMNEELKTAGLLSDGPQDVDDYDKTYAGGFCDFDTTVALYRRKPFQMLATLNAQPSYTLY